MRKDETFSNIAGGKKRNNLNKYSFENAEKLEAEKKTYQRKNELPLQNHCGVCEIRSMEQIDSKQQRRRQQHQQQNENNRTPNNMPQCVYNMENSFILPCATFFF